MERAGEELTPLERDLMGELRTMENRVLHANARLARSGTAFGAVGELLDRGDYDSAHRLSRRFQRWLDDHDRAKAPAE